MPTLYVKKISSLHPTQYKYVNIDNALEEYHNYILACAKSGVADQAKTFEEWLKSEI